MNQPPEVDGIMELEQSETSTIKSKLQSIKVAFVATEEQPVCDTFYLVSTYNKQNVGSEINGDTAESLLS